MNKKESPKVTGISELTGKLVRVRHATEADIPSIERMIKEHKIEVEDLDYSKFLVAAEDSEIIGLGYLNKTEAIYSIGCIAVVEEKRRQGISQLIAKHLADDGSVDRIYVAPALTALFRKLGFVEIKDKAGEYVEALEEACGDGRKPGNVLMARTTSL